VSLVTGDTVLQFEAVSRSFGTVDVLSGVSLSLAAGDVVAVVGPNGSGKTTLLRVAVGDIEPSSGRVTYAGPAAERPIGYLPQRPTFRSGFTVSETMSFYASLVEGTDPETLLERVGLGDAADRDVAALSGGMRRLLGVAQAMVGDPPVVVLDEPASGLDPTMRATVFETAGAIADRDGTVLLSSHDLSLVEETADVVVVLHRGSVAAHGPPETLYDRFETGSLRGVLESVVETTGRVAVTGGDR
jgi:ABC-type multidrug transport system ATPase subunit